MALTDNPTFKKAAARTSSAPATRSVTHSSRPPRAPRSSTSGGGGGRAPARKPAPEKAAPSQAPKKQPSTARQLASPGSNPAKQKAVSNAGPAGRAASQMPDLSAPTLLRKELKSHGSLTSANPRRLVLAEYLVCMTVLGAGTIVAPQGQNGGVPRLVVRGTALSALFMILALVSSAGRSAEKVAAALGGLITVSYVVTSKDSVNLFNWMAGFFSKAGTGAPPAPPAQSGGALGEAGLILESALSADHAAAINQPTGAVGDAGKILGQAFAGLFAAQGGSDIAAGASDSTNVGPPDQVTHGGATAE